VARLNSVTRILTGLPCVCVTAAALFLCASPAQLPRVGDINFYGLRKMTAERILAAAHLAPGDTVPASRVALEDRIIELPDVMDAHVQSVCCDGDHATLFIGIQERGETAIEFRAAPSGTATLPEDLMTQYREYSGALLRAGINGKTNGDAGATDPAMRRGQEHFRTFAAAHTLKLRAELRTGEDAEQRAAAATVMAYSVNKKAAVDDLLFAIQDPDEGVRWRGGSLRWASGFHPPGWSTS
jgi:nitroreductase